MNDNSVDQRGVSAGQDAVGRDKITNVHYSERRTQIDGWLEKLAKELECDARVRDFVDNLQYFMRIYDYDDVRGLEAKLEHANRKTQVNSALRKKEAFVKLLEEWKAFSSAQEIFAFFLSQIEFSFQTNIEPLLPHASKDEVDQAIQTHLVFPVLDTMGTGPFMLNSLNVSGMVYWLAEQCYVRWHQ
jgi:hypothetical protein